MGVKIIRSNGRPEGEPRSWRSLDIRVAKTSEQFDIVIALEASIFADQEPASHSELMLIRERGVLLLLLENSAPVGEAQILYKSIRCLGRFEQVLPKESAFLEAVGLVKVARGRGLQRSLIEACESKARDHKKSTIYTAVREGNGASLRQFLKSGYHIIAYDPTLYGPNPCHARLILERDLEITRPPFADERIDDEECVSFPIIEATNLVGIYVNDGPRPDAEAQQWIARFLRDGYVGVNLYRSTVYPKNVLIMKHLSSFETKRATMLRRRLVRFEQSYARLAGKTPPSVSSSAQWPEEH